MIAHQEQALPPVGLTIRQIEELPQATARFLELASAFVKNETPTAEEVTDVAPAEMELGTELTDIVLEDPDSSDLDA